MRLGRWVAAMVLAGVCPATAADLYASFAAQDLSPAELRVIEAALVSEGMRTEARAATRTEARAAAGPDAGWDAADDTALAAYAERRFGARPRLLHAAALALDFAARIERDGWTYQPAPDLGLTLALPEKRLEPAAPEEGGLRRWSSDGHLTVLTHRFSKAGASSWHAAAAQANAAAADLAMLRADDLLVTRGRLEDGRMFLTRSDRTDRHWATVFLAADPEAETDLELIAASVTADPRATWALPETGRLAAAVSETRHLAAALAATPGPELAPTAARLPEQVTSQATGTGFFMGMRTLVTADHVVQGCTLVTLEDGTALTLLAADPSRDIAVFRAPKPAAAWLTVEGAPEPRLGQPVHAAGFPYFSIVATTLNLTGGNVSALAGVSDDPRFFGFTAPVQPGNSGGPLIAGDGRVAGLVVSRLSEDFIIEETGSLPQNMNFALKPSEIEDFMREKDIQDEPGGIPPFDLHAGAPAELSSAVVPLICY